MNVSGNSLSTVLRGLNNFTSYSVSVAVFTIGTGPSSTAVATTSENGELLPVGGGEGLRTRPHYSNHYLRHTCLRFTSIFPLAPSSYPQGLTAITISSTDILVSWDEIPAIDRNGIILRYEVQYEPLMTFGGQLMTMVMNTSNTSIVLGGLQEYVEYNITVRAYTSVGPGPFSPAVNNRTAEDG